MKELSDDLRLGFARFVVALASNNIPEVGRCFQYAPQHIPSFNQLP